MFLYAWKPAASAVFISPDEPWVSHPERLSSSAGGTAIYSLVTVVDRTQVENPLSHFSLRSYYSWAFLLLSSTKPTVAADGSEMTEFSFDISPSLSAEMLMNHELTQKPEGYEVEEKMSGIQLPQRSAPSNTNS